MTDPNFSLQSTSRSGPRFARPLRIATRGSDLALWQARFVQVRLAAMGVDSSLEIIETQGDRDHAAFSTMQGRGFFTKAVQDAVLDDRADLAVHSLKDLPSAAMPGLTLAAIPEREDARETLLVRVDAFDAGAGVLPVRAGSRVGSSAVRRQAQVATLRPDLERLELRGNVPTRVEKLRRGQFDAILLAWAGLKRLSLDLSDLRVVILEPEAFMPAPGQGALALECRSDDPSTLEVLAQLDDPNARASVQAERGLMAKLEGGCQLALGAFARLERDGVQLLAWFEGRLFEARAATPNAVADAVFLKLRGQR